jgi:hypothetical protein
MFKARSYFAVMGLIVLNISTCAYYYAFRPHIGKGKQKIEMLNEWMIVMLSYCTFFFTDIIPPQSKMA